MRDLAIVLTDGILCQYAEVSDPSSDGIRLRHRRELYDIFLPLERFIDIADRQADVPHRPRIGRVPARHTQGRKVTCLLDGPLEGGIRAALSANVPPLGRFFTDLEHVVDEIFD
jgi:hypothetical protein